MKVLVAMSGGVDSSVAAAELKAAGHEVVGVTMRLWGGESLRPIAVCCSEVSICEHREVIAEKPSVSIDPEREHKGNGCNDTDRPIKLTAC